MPSAGASGAPEVAAVLGAEQLLLGGGDDRSGSSGSTTKSMISPRGVKGSVNVLPPSSEISIAMSTASNA